MTIDDYGDFLKKRGYSLVTPSDHPSTVYDYQKRVQTICAREHIPSLDILATKIDSIVIKYSIGGKESAFGARSHNAYINALRRFQEFCKEQDL